MASALSEGKEIEPTRDGGLEQDTVKSEKGEGREEGRGSGAVGRVP